MAKEKAISDEMIISALLTAGTIKQAAAAVGLSERTVYDRMNTGEFQALYKAAKADLIRSAVFSINSKLQEAIDTITEIMNDTETNAAVRLQAAQTILNNAGKFAARLQSNEDSIISQTESNEFNDKFFSWL